MSSIELYTYRCKRAVDKLQWDSIEGISLVDVATGGGVLEETIVKASWDGENLYLRYECVDSYLVSPFENYGDPLYLHDVVEAFIAETDDGKQYAEIVVSPNNIVFDAWINHHDDNQPTAFLSNTDWAVQGLVTRVEEKHKGRNYELTIPFHNFSGTPKPGDKWRINFFRIDEEPSGQQHFQAWSPTGLINYHVPDKFGWIKFEEKL